MKTTCVNCGCKEYNGHCTNCHEETYIAEQNYNNDEPIAFSDGFKDKLGAQKIEAKKRRRLIKRIILIKQINLLHSHQ